MASSNPEHSDRIETILTSQYLEQRYLRDNLLVAQIAEETGFALCTICNRLKRLEIKKHHKRGAERSKSSRWKGYGEISGKYWTSVKCNAKVRGFDLHITIEYVWELYLSQAKRCALSGALIGFESRYQQTASLDRIDSNLGYIRGNLQWVHKEVNLMKRHLSDEVFISWCHTISKYHEELLE